MSNSGGSLDLDLDRDVANELLAGEACRRAADAGLQVDDVAPHLPRRDRQVPDLRVGVEPKHLGAVVQGEGLHALHVHLARGPVGGIAKTSLGHGGGAVGALMVARVRRGRGRGSRGRHQR